MNLFSQLRLVDFFVLLGLCSAALGIGCSRQSEPPAVVENASEEENATSVDAEAAAESPPTLPRVTPPRRVAPPVRAAVPAATSTDADLVDPERAASDAPSVNSVTTSGLQLPPGDAPTELKTFLATADRELERLGSGRSPIQEREALVAEIRLVAELKQQAAERLLEAPQVDEQDRAIGTRARMQALSHKAALGDLRAAEALEQYAVELLNHPADDIARDSRAVLIGFALERLQGGVTEEPEEVLRFVSELGSRPELVDASSLMAMQRAMTVLRQYGYVEAADQVRDQIASSFLGVDDPHLSELATDVLAAARFDELETMRRDIASAAGRVPESWGEKATEVAAEHPDLMTVQYLASLALQLESMGRSEEANEVYEAIQQQLTSGVEPEVASAAERAVAAHRARQSVIGQRPNVTATTDLAGEAFEMESFRGSIVLMPFWAVEEPGSIDALPGLEQFAAEYGDRVKLLGVNMDVSPAGQNRAADLARRSMLWPSISAADDGGTAYESQVARQLGVVSMPTVVVLDSEGQVVAVALSHEGVVSAVQELIAE